MKNKMISVLKKCMGAEKSSHRLALAFSLGTYIAFSPFLGLHTALVFVLGWLFTLSIPITLAATYLVNNPWTMIPIYSAGYTVGYFVLYKITNIGLYLHNPWWMHTINNFITMKLSVPELNVWSFFIGANLLGVLSACIAYPLTRPLFSRLLEQSD